MMKKYLIISALCIQSVLLVASQNMAPKKTAVMLIPKKPKTADDHISPGDYFGNADLSERNMSYSPSPYSPSPYSYGEQSVSPAVPKNSLRRKSNEKSWR